LSWIKFLLAKTKNMKLLNCLTLILIVLSCNSKVSNLADNEKKNKVLFICTSESEFNGYKNGTYLEEIAIPIYEFHKKEVEIDILSPKGGAIPIYYKFDTTAILQQAIESNYYLDKVANSKRMEAINIEKYAAIVIPGGYGQFKDLHQHTPIKKMIVTHYENGGIIGTIGHGTALLSQLTLKNGRHLVNGVTMTCFPNWNELNIMEEANKGKLLPFLMEEELRNNGADLKIYDHEKKINYEIIDADKKIVTAAFASGGTFVSNKIMLLMNGL